MHDICTHNGISLVYEMSAIKTSWKRTISRLHIPVILGQGETLKIISKPNYVIYVVILHSHKSIQKNYKLTEHHTIKYDGIQ